MEITNKIFFGDCRETMKQIPEKSVQMCVTSPPYFGLRSYDPNAVIIDPSLDDDTRAWLMAELSSRDIHAR